MTEFSAIILAAGKGVRMKSPLPKVLHTLAGKPLVDHVIRETAAVKKYVKEIVVVVGFGAAAVKKEIQDYCRATGCFDVGAIKFVPQKELLGTADAVKCGLAEVRYKNVLILCGDAPLVTRATLASFIESFTRSKVVCSLISAQMYQPNQFGRIIRDESGAIRAIREQGDLDSGALARFTEINSGMYAFDAETLRRGIERITLNPRKKEYFLTDAIEILYKDGAKIGYYLLADTAEILGINNRVELAMAEKIAQIRVCNHFIEEGVRIVDPGSTFIAEGVKIGKNTLIYPFTFIEKNVIIGSNCALGPFVRLRQGTVISDNASLGNFLEICRSKIGKGVKIRHFSYLGDTRVYDDVNIGAGCVVANYDGKNKNKTVIEKGAFIGSDSILVAPVKIGKGAVTGAGSVVTKNVKAKTVVVGVPARPIRKK